MWKRFSSKDSKYSFRIPLVGPHDGNVKDSKVEVKIEVNRGFEGWREGVGEVGRKVRRKFEGERGRHGVGHWDMACLRRIGDDVAAVGFWNSPVIMDITVVCAAPSYISASSTINTVLRDKSGTMTS